MKTLMRHGLAVCLALTTMCTSLLLLYSSLSSQKERPPQQQQPQHQHQQQATGSAQPSAESSSASRPGAPVGPRPLDGYLGVADHKEDLQYLAQHWLVHDDDCAGAL
ncbi:alpha-N-acetylgalactosaminide alpha-2,6-sialyltransferase 5 isoform X2 [Rhinolophus ferrumequinum]|uniref:ST6 N-acetylgalactosaminide alpha-2,6-sialyltransferase 5 n=1 Tax=Rhinolophus ferrumequinum TaxID=59479 RepID=A0A671E5E6_RHIFE|nr:alpha-N-acetylgalactosaminide alpha-2,6-sialyltransferase 5 isoform X2 [Rhinolophus ferrumequinum]